jgi:hypothetical protein
MAEEKKKNEDVKPPEKENNKPPVPVPDLKPPKGGDPKSVNPLPFKKITDEISACDLPYLGSLVKNTDAKGNESIVYVLGVTPKIDPKTGIFTLVKSMK